MKIFPSFIIRLIVSIGAGVGALSQSSLPPITEISSSGFPSTINKRISRTVNPYLDVDFYYWKDYSECLAKHGKNLDLEQLIKIEKFRNQITSPTE